LIKKTALVQIILFFCLYGFSQNENRGIKLSNTDQSSEGKCHAIIISENQYQDESISDLAEPKNDADKLYKILREKEIQMTNLETDVEFRYNKK